MTFTHALSTNNYGPAKFIVATSAANGTHTTLASAMASASSGDTIFLRDSVTENITLTPGVNIVSYTGSEFTPTVSITGKLTMTGAGTCTVSGIRLTTNSDFILAVTGSAASIVNLVDCYLNISNNNAISHTSSDGGSQITLYRCDGNITTTGITVFVSTSAGSITHSYTRILNSGGSTTTSSISTGIFFQRYSTIAVPVTTSSVGSLDWDHSKLSGTNATGITTAGTGVSTFHMCYFTTGSASCLSVGSGTQVDLIDCEFNSSNTNVVTGAGTVAATSMAFSGTSSVINPTTTTLRYTDLIGYKATAQPAFHAYNSASDVDVTGDGTQYTVLCDTEIYDVGGNYDGTTGTFTAPVTGKYMFVASVLLAQVIATMQCELNIVTTARTYTFGNTGTSLVGNVPLSYTIIADMAATNTATMRIRVSNGTKVVDLYGAGATDQRTFFQGFLMA